MDKPRSFSDPWDDLEELSSSLDFIMQSTTPWPTDSTSVDFFADAVCDGPSAPSSGLPVAFEFPSSWNSHSASGTAVAPLSSFDDCPQHQNQHPVDPMSSFAPSPATVSSPVMTESLGSGSHSTASVENSAVSDEDEDTAIMYIPTSSMGDDGDYEDTGIDEDDDEVDDDEEFYLPSPTTSRSRSAKPASRRATGASTHSKRKRGGVAPPSAAAYRAAAAAAVPAPLMRMSASEANARVTPASQIVTCALCCAGYKNGDKWRNIRRIHLHWYLLMESGSLRNPSTAEPLRLISDWQEKDPYKRWAKAKDQRVSSHFKVFTHEALARAFEPCSTDILVHKHCLHAFNFIVKARYDDLVAVSGYSKGPTPAEFGSTYSKRDLDPEKMFNPTAKSLLYVRASSLFRQSSASSAASAGSTATTVTTSTLVLPIALPCAAASTASPLKRRRKTRSPSRGRQTAVSA